MDGKNKPFIGTRLDEACCRRNTANWGERFMQNVTKFSVIRLLTNFAVQCPAVAVSGLKTRSYVSSLVEFSPPEIVSELALTYRLCPTTDCSA